MKCEGALRIIAASVQGNLAEIEFKNGLLKLLEYDVIA